MDDEFLPRRNRHSLPQASEARPCDRRATGSLSRLPGLQGVRLSVRPHLDQRDGASGRMRQPPPSVTEADIERVVRRDFPATVAAEILDLIATIDVREKPRVVLACLKIANGDLDRLRADLADASGWYREFLGEAEYPLATKRWSRMASLPENE